ncbi:MAG: response regulator [Spongiibacteraceae bacterium]
MRFLVVDDSRAMQSIVRRGLQKAGYGDLDIKLANDGLEALEIIKVWNPDMVLSDWHMPNMSGVELLNTIKQQMLDVKIGFVTTESSPQRLQEALQAGALFIVNKPFTDDDLVRAVVGAIETSPPASSSTETNSDEASRSHGNTLDGEQVADAVQQLSLPSADLLAQTINRLSRLEIFTEEIEPIRLSDMIMPSLLGLFEDANHRSRALIVMDLRTVCILGAAITGEEPQITRANILQQTITAESFKACNQILQNAAALVSVRSTEKALTLRSANIIKKTFPKLELLYERRNIDRSDYEIAAATYGQGLMTIIAT